MDSGMGLDLRAKLGDFSCMGSRISEGGGQYWRIFFKEEPLKTFNHGCPWSLEKQKLKSIVDLRQAELCVRDKKGNFSLAFSPCPRRSPGRVSLTLALVTQVGVWPVALCSTVSSLRSYNNGKGLETQFSFLTERQSESFLYNTADITALH